MKKLLLVLMVVALAAFLLVGCIPSTPAEGEGEGEGEVETCPTLSVSGEVTITGAKYLKKGTQTITVTFAAATQPVSVYVGAKLDGDTATKANPVGIPETAQEVAMSADATKKVYTGKFYFKGDADCDKAYIYVVTCGTCAPCKYAYTVDNLGPCSEILIREYPTTGCSCGGVNINFVTEAAACVTCCGDYCTGLNTATFDLYKTNPFGACCDIPCISPIATCTSTGCNINCTIPCFDIYAHYAYVAGTNDATAYTFWLVTTLADKVGNKTYYYAKVAIDSGTVKTVTEYKNDTAFANCTTWASGAVRADGIIGACADVDGVCGTVSIAQ
jgi:predicted small secreted protein